MAWEYVILNRLPTAQNYHDLRRDANLTPPPMHGDIVQRALDNSFVCFLAFERNLMLDDTTPGSNQEAVGMGRLLGDGTLFLQLCDVAVHPAHQGKGIGKQIIQKLVEYTDEHAPQAYVSLVGEPMGQGLYTKYGFEDVSPSIGMFYCPRIQNDPEFRKLRESKAAQMTRK
ncbi:acyl-CoA N-acyltransferase [Lophiotrema nucula]|uniref:Acyl-CoA N-acyltransferase n=1 Tax=Lophiotrema nucula TaxID=690887 RepID=A0A6A5YQ20_9PLEO|nr:acyl-CoA N-acyltransferase [Lophiotrema nucula]